MRWTRSLSSLAIGLALTWSAARAQGPAHYWPGTTMGPQAPVMQPGYPYPPAAPLYQAPPAPPAGPGGPGSPALPPMPAEPPMAPGSAPTALIHPATNFPTPEYHDLNGLSNGGNSFDNQLEEDCHPCLIANLEYLGWWVRPFHGPVFLTTGSPKDQVPGALDPHMNTQTVLAPDIFPGQFNGGRIRLEYLFPNTIDACTGCYLFGHSQYLSVDGSVFGLEDRQRTLDVASDAHGNPVLSRPFFNAAANREDVDPVSLPHILAGSTEVAISNKLYGGEANVRVTQYGGGASGSRIGILAGARYLSLDQTLRVDMASRDIGPPPLGTVFVEDSYGTHNRFWGGQIGLDVKFYWWDRIDLTTVGKIAVGPVDETLHLTGLTSVTNPSATATDRGLFVQPTNVGTYTKHKVTFAPEVTTTLGCRIAEGVRIYAGYNFLYLRNIFAPADQIDRRISIQTVPAPGTIAQQLGPTLPSVNLTTTDFWVQGIVAGLEFNY
jgi:hypothetical protein